MSLFAVPAGNLTLRTPRVVRPTVASAPKVWLRSDGPFELGTGIKTWYDRSGNGNHVTQATGGNQPVLVASSVNMGNRPSVQFTAASAMRLVNAGFAALGGLAGATIFCVVKDSTQVNEYVTGTIPMRMQIGAGASNCRITDVDYVGGGAVPATKSVLEAVYDGTATGNTNRLKFIINGTDGTVAGGGTIPATLPVTTGLTVGSYDSGASPFEQEIAEYIIYLTTLSASDRSLVRQYLGTLYGITVA